MADSFGASALKSGGPSMSLIDKGSSVGVGNYKGVMLCNRPFGGTEVPSNRTDPGDKSSFSCGVVPASIGQTVLISSKEKFRLQRSNKDSVLSKHKKWLSDLQKTKNELERQYVDEMQKKEEAKQKFVESQERLRAQVRGVTQAGEEKETGNQVADSKEEYKAESPENEIMMKMAAAESKRQKGKAKPAWALTEKASEDKEFEDDEGLLEFAENLDFDRTMDDIEVQAITEKLKKRIGELEKEVAQDELREVDAETRKKKRDMLALMGETANMIENGREAKDEDEGLSTAARELLRDDEIQAVHSTKSVVAMLKAARDKVASKTRSGPDGFIKKTGNTNEPLIVVHDPSEGMRLEGKNSVSNLPYIHRNPAI